MCRGRSAKSTGEWTFWGRNIFCAYATRENEGAAAGRKSFAKNACAHSAARLMHIRCLGSDGETARTRDSVTMVHLLLSVILRACPYTTYVHARAQIRSDAKRNSSALISSLLDSGPPALLY